jgi:hypothetical protein
MRTYNTTIANNLEAVISHLNSLDDNELVNVHNTYCRNQNYSDDEIYSNDEDFFNTFFEGKTNEAVRAVCYGEYEYMNEYVKFNGYGNLVSFNNPSAYIDITAIANDILEDAREYDIELEECFVLNGITYEGTEEEAKEQYEEEKEAFEEYETNEGEEFTTFDEWVRDNITIFE